MGIERVKFEYIKTLVVIQQQLLVAAFKIGVGGYVVCLAASGHIVWSCGE